MLWLWNLAQVACFQQHPDQQSLRMHATVWKACLTCAWARIRRPKLAYGAQLRQLRRSHLEDGFQDPWAKKSKANRIGQCSQAVSYRIRSGKPALSAQAVWWTGATDKHLSRVGISPSFWSVVPFQYLTARESKYDGAKMCAGGLNNTFYSHFITSALPHLPFSLTSQAITHYSSLRFHNWSRKRRNRGLTLNLTCFVFPSYHQNLHSFHYRSIHGL